MPNCGLNISFQITPAMREALFQRLQDDKVPVSREAFDAAASYVDDQLGYEISRELFGTESVGRRQAKADRQLQAALRLLRDSDSQQETITSAVAAQAAVTRDGRVPRRDGELHRSMTRR